jgi:hypothetical protein
MGALMREIYGRLATVDSTVPPEAKPLLDDIVDQFSLVYVDLGQEAEWW